MPQPRQKPEACRAERPLLGRGLSPSRWPHQGEKCWWSQSLFRRPPSQGMLPSVSKGVLEHVPPSVIWFLRWICVCAYIEHVQICVWYTQEMDSFYMLCKKHYPCQRWKPVTLEESSCWHCWHFFRLVGSFNFSVLKVAICSLAHPMAYLTFVGWRKGNV